MTPTETAAILRQFNEWRLGDEDLPQLDVKQITAAIYAAIGMIERLEAAESDCLEQARLNGMGASREAALMAKLEAAEKERDALRAAVQHEAGCVEAAKAEIETLRAKVEPVLIELLDRLEAAERERDALRAELKAAHAMALNGVEWRELAKKYEAEIAAMERQEPVAWARKLGLDVPSFGCVTDLKYRPSDIPESSYIPLYLAPGAQPAPKAVAYLDLGVGGYMDIGTDLTDEALAAIPKGRHMLGIVGTYGVGGYVSSQPAQSVPDGWKLVPIEPTHEMLDAGEDTYIPTYTGTSVSAPIDVYRAMLAAAPEAKP